MTLGFVGTGAITAAIVTGLSSEGGPRQQIRLSPRNADVASDLARQFDNVRVCPSNQAVLDSSDTVILAIRPQVAEDVLSALCFSADHTVISLVAGFPVRRIEDLVAPASRITRAVPLPSVAQRRSPIALYPAGGSSAELFTPLGFVAGVDEESHLAAFGAATSTMAAHFAFVGQIASWLAGKGIPEEQAREYMARVFAGLSEAGLSAYRCSFEELASAHATPGGLNEQVLRDLREQGVFEILATALDAVYRRSMAHPA